MPASHSTIQSEARDADRARNDERAHARGDPCLLAPPASPAGFVGQTVLKSMLLVSTGRCMAYRFTLMIWPSRVFVVYQAGLSCSCVCRAARRACIHVVVAALCSRHLAWCPTRTRSSMRSCLDLLVSVRCQCRWTFDPIRSKSQTHIHLFERRGTAASMVQVDASRTFARDTCCVWSDDGQDTCSSSDGEDLENLAASEIRVERFQHQEVAHEGKLLFPCAGSLKLFDLLTLPRGEMTARRNPGQDEKEEEDTILGEENGR